MSGYEHVTMPELARMKQLADAGMPTGSIAIAVGVDFGTTRSPDSIRSYLRRYHGWHGKPRGRPFTGDPDERRRIG